MAYLGEMKYAEIRTAEDAKTFYSAQRDYIDSNVAGLISPELQKSSRIGQLIRLSRKKLGLSTEEVSQELATGDAAIKIEPIKLTVWEHGFEPFPSGLTEKVTRVLLRGKAAIIAGGNQKENTSVPA